MSLRSLLAGLGIVVALAIVAGCGSDSDDGGGDESAVALSKAEFVAQANALCRQNRKDVVKLLGEYQEENGRLDPRDVGEEAVGETLLPVLREEVEEVRELGIPSSDKAEIEAFLSAREEALETIEDQGLSSNNELFAEFERSDRLGAGTGLRSCNFGFS